VILHILLYVLVTSGESCNFLNIHVLQMGFFDHFFGFLVIKVIIPRSQKSLLFVSVVLVCKRLRNIVAEILERVKGSLF